MVIEKPSSTPSTNRVKLEDDFPILELILRNYLTHDEIMRVRQAYFLAYDAHQDQKRDSGEPYITHPLAVAEILAEYQWPAEVITAGLLHDVLEDTHYTYEDLVREFGASVAGLVRGVTKVSEIAYSFHREEEAENFRRMLVATAKDLHVIVIKLADRLHNMRTLRFLPRDRQLRIAKNTLDIFAPLAHRLGLGRIKWELEDLALIHLHPDVYQDIKQKIALKRREREQYLNAARKELEDALKKEGFHCTVEGRAKHFYSIYQKMLHDKKTFEEIFDLIALRVICETIGECYGILGEVHTMWRQVEGRFKDYISNPKPNNYRSIHTTVLGPHGRRIEIQIRTLEMHLDAEYGIAAHWRYKEEKSTPLKRDTNWLEQFVQELPDTHDPEEFLQSVRNDLFSDEVYVYTPKGEIQRLPKDATPIDLAYKIHTELGNHCGGAKVNSRMVSLNYRLKTGDVVEIIANQSCHPSPAWLNIVKTSSARNKIRRFLLDSRRGELLQIGQTNLSRELQKAGFNHLEFYNSAKAREIIASLNTKDLEDLLVNIGFGRISTKQVIARLLPPVQKSMPPRADASASSRAKGGGEPILSVVRLGDIDDILYRRALCCNPLPGDDIIGFVTRGRGVTIHRTDCSNVKQFQQDPGRILPLFWEEEQQGHVNVTIEIRARDRHNLLSDVSQMISATGTNIVSSKSETVSEIATFVITMDITSVSHLETVMQQLLGVEGVKSVRKVRNTHMKSSRSHNGHRAGEGYSANRSDKRV